MTDASLESAPASVPAAPQQVISPFKQWYAVSAVAMLYTVALIDRGAISLVVDPIKADLGLNDTQISMLVGMSFLIFYMLTSIPMGWLADRVSRKGLLGISALLWASATTLCGFAQNFWHLFIGRASVGFSEGGLTPTVFSLLRDTIAPERRGRAFAIYHSGAFFGGALALFLSGAVLAFVGDGINVPIIGEVEGWQMVFFVVGLGALPFAALLIPIVEPIRRTVKDASEIGYAATGKYLLRNWRLYLPFALFNVAFGTMAYTYASWAPPLAARTFDIPLPEVGLIMGIIVLTCPPAGLLIGGTLIDWLRKRGRNNGAAIVMVGMLLGCFVPGVAAPLMPSAFPFWCLYAVFLVFSGGAASAAATFLSWVAPSQFAGKLAALHGLTANVFGATMGPLIVGLFSDYLFEGQKALAYAVSLTSIIFVAIASPLGLWLLRASGRRAREEAAGSINYA